MDILKGLTEEDKLVQEVEVPIEHLDYSYVEKCQDPHELKQILALLKSGKEGKFPALEQTVEDRMLSLLPASERATWIAMTRDPTYYDRMLARKEVEEFLQSLGQGTDSKGTQAGSGSSPSASTVQGKPLKKERVLPPVRGMPEYTGSSTQAGIPTSSTAGAEKTANNHMNEVSHRMEPKAEPIAKQYEKWETMQRTFDLDDALAKAEQDLAAMVRAVWVAMHRLCPCAFISICRIDFPFYSFFYHPLLYYLAEKGHVFS